MVKRAEIDVREKERGVKDMATWAAAVDAALKNLPDPSSKPACIWDENTSTYDKSLEYDDDDEEVAVEKGSSLYFYGSVVAAAAARVPTSLRVITNLNRYSPAKRPARGASERCRRAARTARRRRWARRRTHPVDDLAHGADDGRGAGAAAPSPACEADDSASEGAPDTLHAYRRGSARARSNIDRRGRPAGCLHLVVRSPIPPHRKESAGPRTRSSTRPARGGRRQQTTPAGPFRQVQA